MGMPTHSPHSTDCQCISLPQYMEKIIVGFLFLNIKNVTTLGQAFNLVVYMPSQTPTSHSKYTWA